MKRSTEFTAPGAQFSSGGVATPASTPLRKLLARGALLGCAALASFPALAADPTLPKSIKIIVPFSAGGSNDVFARAVARSLASRNNIVVVVDNRPGAGGAIGADSVARSDPDGATLLLTSVSFSTNAAIQPKLPYDAIKSFEPVSMIARGGMVLVANNSTPYKNTAELIAAMKKNGSSINYGSAGVGTIGQMATELFNYQAGASSTHIPYKGINNAVTDMIGGNIQMMIATPASVGGQIKGHQIRALAVTSAARSKFYPDLPTIAEVLPGYDVEAWWGVLAPAKTPKALVDALNKEIQTITQQADVKNLFMLEGAEPTNLSAGEFAAYLKEELTKWKKIAKERNITPG
jgi:tripartite-type tricarboxylate transporter receptor subunit TctC